MMLILVKFHQGYTKEKHVSYMIYIQLVCRSNSIYTLYLMSICMSSLEQLLQTGLDRNALIWRGNKNFLCLTTGVILIIFFALEKTIKKTQKELYALIRQQQEQK